MLDQLSKLANIVKSTITRASSSYEPSLPQADDFIRKIIPNFWAFLAQLLAFVVICILFFIIGYKPIRKILDQRKNKIESDLLNASNNNLESERNIKKSELMILESEKKAEEIILEAKKKAETIEREKVQETSLYIEEMKKAMDKEIEASKLAAQEDIKKEIVNVALEASKHILNREINEIDDSKIVNDFLASDKDKND